MKWRTFSSRRLCALDLAGTQTTGAGVDVARFTAHNRLNPFDIRFPHTVAFPVGVGHVITESYAFSADITFSHGAAPPLN